MGTIITALILSVIIGLIIFRLVKDKKTGKSSCGCGCSGCAMRDQCHPKDK